MRIGLVSPYDFATAGGVNDHVRHLARQLRRLGHEARIFAPSSRADVDFDTARFYRIGSPIAIPVNEFGGAHHAQLSSLPPRWRQSSRRSISTSSTSTSR